MTTFTLKNGKPTIDKDPGALLDYSLDIAEWLGTDEVIAVDASVVGVTLDRPATYFNAILTAWLDGGVVDEDASVTFRFITAAGRVDERTLHFTIRER